MFGLVFEIVLIALVIGQYKEGWFFVELYNFSLISHYPLLLLASALNSDVIGVILSFVYAVMLAWLWAVIFDRVMKWFKQKFVQHGASRRQKWIVAAGLAVLFLTALSWHIIDSHFDQPTSFTPSSDVKLLVEGNNAFALDLYQQLKGQPHNLFFSPYSISAGMGMVYAGARGPTERELASALHFNLTQNNLHPAFGQLFSRLITLQHWHHLTLLPANSLWYQQNYKFTPDFINSVRTNYQGEMRPVDFEQAASNASRELAAWIEKKTGGRLKGSVNPGLFTPDTRLALCDTIYFKGQWASQFRRSNTNPRPFSITTNQTVTVPMMYQKGEFKMGGSDYGDGLYMQMLELPYYGRDVSMIILLPNQVDGLAELERQLNPASLHEWLTKLDKSYLSTTRVSLPRFTVTQNFDLGKTLRSLGVTNLFDAGAADLSGMESTTNLYISDILHQAFVEVNEHGTEAAVMTLALANTKGIDNRFIADHPFIFLIRDNATGSILFLGRMVDPTKP